LCQLARLDGAADDRGYRVAVGCGSHGVGVVLGPLDVVQHDGAGHFEDGVDGLPVVRPAGFDDDVDDKYVIDLAFGDEAVFLGSYDGCEEGGSGFPSACQQYASPGEVELVSGEVEDALACSSLGWSSSGCGGCQMRRWPEGVVGSRLAPPRSFRE